jgi:predicted transcriptional regulator
MSRNYTADICSQKAMGIAQKAVSRTYSNKNGSDFTNDAVRTRLDNEIDSFVYNKEGSCYIKNLKYLSEGNLCKFKTCLMNKTADHVRDSIKICNNQKNSTFKCVKSNYNGHTSGKSGFKYANPAMACLNKLR